MVTSRDNAFRGDRFLTMAQSATPVLSDHALLRTHMCDNVYALTLLAAGQRPVDVSSVDVDSNTGDRNRNR